MAIESDLRRLSHVIGLALGVAALPLFARLAALEPPWPDGIAGVSSALAVLAVVTVSAAR